MKKRDGFSLIELFIVIGFAGVLVAAISVSLFSRKDTLELDRTARQMVATLRDAQNRSLNQQNNTSWGVRFENATNTRPFFALFKGSTYSQSSTVTQLPLPSNVFYATSTLPTSTPITIVFAQVTGRPSASTSIKLYLSTDGTASATVSVSPAGLVGL